MFGRWLFGCAFKYIYIYVCVCLLSTSPLSHLYHLRMWRNWVPESIHYCPKTPFLLARTKIDLKDDDKTVAKLARNRQEPITFENLCCIKLVISSFKNNVETSSESDGVLVFSCQLQVSLLLMKSYRDNISHLVMTLLKLLETDRKLQKTDKKHKNTCLWI